MNPRFTFDGVTVTTREDHDFSVLVNRLITKRFGRSAAANREDIHYDEYPVRSWSGIVKGITYEIREVEETPAIIALAAATDAVELQASKLRAAQAARDDAVRAAFAEGATAAMIANASGLSTARAYQIRDK